MISSPVDAEELAVDEDPDNVVLEKPALVCAQINILEPVLLNSVLMYTISYSFFEVFPSLYATGNSWQSYSPMA